jgi:NADPH:quinone reductase-like Zn-dependent oxidoreductase
MRAVVVRKGRGPAIEEVTDPMVGERDVVVDVRFASVNPGDLMVAGGSAQELFGLPDVVGVGYEFSGAVRAVGADVSDLRPGDRVAGAAFDLAAPTRAHADRVVVDRNSLDPIPAGLGDEPAATIGMNGLTAWQALDLLGEPRGDLLVTGAAGALGGYVVRLAAERGWQVHGLARGADREFVIASGARTLLTEIDPGRYPAVLDAAALQAVALAAVADGGRFVGVLPPMPVASERGIEVSTVSVRPDRAVLGDLLARAARGELTTRVAGTVDLQEALTAYEKVAAGGHRGRWLLEP